MDATLVKGLAVGITLADGRRSTATVAAVDSGYVDLRLDPAIEVRSLPGRSDHVKATIAWRTKIGGAILSGEISPLADSTVWRLQTTAAIESIQRRDHVRVAAEIPTAVITSGNRVVSRTLDISLGGLMLVDADELKGTDNVRIAIDLDDLTVTGNGTIVRVYDDGRAAIRFTDLAADAEQHLSQFIARRQRELAHPK